MAFLVHVQVTLLGLRMLIAVVLPVTVRQLPPLLPSLTPPTILIVLTVCANTSDTSSWLGDSTSYMLGVQQARRVFQAFLGWECQMFL